MNNNKLVYIAGPLFSQADRRFLENLIDVLTTETGLDPIKDFYLPHRDGGELGKGPKRIDIFNLDIAIIDKAKIIVAFLDGQDVDSGTCIELGYAYAKGKKIFGILTDFRAYCTLDKEPHIPNLMVWGVCEKGKTLYYDVLKLAKSFSNYFKSIS